MPDVKNRSSSPSIRLGTIKQEHDDADHTLNMIDRKATSSGSQLARPLMHSSFPTLAAGSPESLHMREDRKDSTDARRQANSELRSSSKSKEKDIQQPAQPSSQGYENDHVQTTGRDLPETLRTIRILDTPEPAEVPVHPDVPGLACNHCVQDYEREPGLICRYQWGAGLPCDRCVQNGHRTCSKIALVNDRGEPRRDRQPIIDLQHMAAEMHKHSLAGNPIPQELKEKMKILQAAVIALSRIIADSASKERTLRRALRFERANIEEERMKTQAERRKADRERQNAESERRRAETEAQRADGEKQRMADARLRIERLLSRGKQQTTQIQWLKARNVRLESREAAETTTRAVQAQLNETKARLEELKQSSRAAQASASARERRGMRMQAQLISSQIELWYRKG